MNNLENRKNLYIRFLIFLLGLIVLAFGVAFSIKANLGTSPIASVSYVFSLLTPFSVGQITVFVHSTLIAMQILILRKKYKISQLLQLPVAFIFGFFTDFTLWAIKSFNYSNYFGQWVLCIVGIVLNSIGVYLLVKANIVTLAAEGLVISVCRVIPIKFGNMKIILDISFVLLAGILSLTFLNEIHGVGEGTLATAILVGYITKLLDKIVGSIKSKYAYKIYF